jgi:hypothetical protein
MSLLGSSFERNSICAMIALAESSVTGPAEHDDAVLEQARVNVIRPLTAAGFFDDDRESMCFAIVL